jgi:hypothetical protein
VLKVGDKISLQHKILSNELPRGGNRFSVVIRLGQLVDVGGANAGDFLEVSTNHALAPDILRVLRDLGLAGVVSVVLVERSRKEA